MTGRIIIADDHPLFRSALAHAVGKVWEGATIIEASTAAEALAAIRVPLIRLGGRLEAILADPPDWLDAQGRARIEGARFALAWRIDLIAAWEALLHRLGGPADPEFVDWLAVDRSDAREFDVAIHRRWLDPMKPFARVVLEPAHGVLLTSATLTDRGAQSIGSDQRRPDQSDHRHKHENEPLVFCLHSYSLIPLRQVFGERLRPFHGEQARYCEPTDRKAGDGISCNDVSGVVHSQSSAIRRIRASIRIVASALRIRINVTAPNSKLKPTTAANNGQR